jgi:hypothetical protein
MQHEQGTHSVLYKAFALYYLMLLSSVHWAILFCSVHSPLIYFKIALYSTVRAFIVWAFCSIFGYLCTVLFSNDVLFFSVHTEWAICCILTLWWIVQWAFYILFCTKWLLCSIRLVRSEEWMCSTLFSVIY